MHEHDVGHTGFPSQANNARKISIIVPFLREPQSSSPDMLHIRASERCQNTACLKLCLARDSVRRW
jgi:hypothetical protein